MSSQRNIFRIATITALVVFFLGIVPEIAHGASIPNLFACATSPVTCALYGVSWAINGFLGLIIGLGSYLITWGLRLDANVFSSQTVQTGFSIMLSVANLGFVFGIVVIALATILRNETYGIKQMLWKLIVMAILVNFGLVITGPIVGFADSLTNYFLNADGGTLNFVNNLTAAFAPQSLMSPDPAAQEPGVACSAAGWLAFDPTGVLAQLCQNAYDRISTDGSGASNFTTELFSLLFSVVFEIIVAVTFLTIAIALISRYIYLAFLLIILPLAWLSWVIPKMEHHFVKWWSTFFKWTFFPAISIMFVYLAMLSVTVTNGNVSVKDAQVQPIDSQKGSPLLAVSTAIGGNSNLIQTALDEILMAGLCLGGLFAANELSIKGADTAIHGLTKVKDAAVGYVGKEAKKGARYTYQRVGGQKLNERLQRSRIPGVSRLGTAMQDVTKKGGKDLVKKEAENLHLGDRGDDELERMLQGARPMDRKLAILGEYQKRDKLDKVKSIDGVDLSTWLQRPDSERAFKDYDHGKLQKDIDNSLNSDKTMRAVAKKQGSVMVADTNNYLGKGVNAMVPAVDLSRRASEEARKAQDVGDKLEERKKKGENISDADINLNKQEVSKAEAARKAANAAMDDVTVVDTEGILDEKAKGAEVKAGNLMRAASKKFYAGKDASDIGKSNPGAIFDGKAHYGLDERSLKALSRAVSHGIASEIPSVVSKITGKLDSQSKLEALAAEWHGAIIDAYEYDAEKRGQLLDSFKKVMGNKLLFASSEAPAPVAAAGGGGAAPAAGH